GRRSQPGPKGRMPIKGPMPAPGRVVPDYGPVGSRRPPPSESVGPPPPPLRGAAPPPIRMQFSHPAAPPPAESRMARARGEGARRKNGSSNAGASIHPTCRDTWVVPATGPCRSGAEVGTHDGTDGAGNAASV
ncbi:MAG: hypothetical protein ACK56F_02450, partial [bacterium]